MPNDQDAVTGYFSVVTEADSVQIYESLTVEEVEPNGPDESEIPYQGFIPQSHFVPPRVVVKAEGGPRVRPVLLAVVPINNVTTRVILDTGAAISLLPLKIA